MSDQPIVLDAVPVPVPVALPRTRARGSARIWLERPTNERGPELAAKSGRRLRQLLGRKQYWFDWKLQRPHTTVYARGDRG